MDETRNNGVWAIVTAQGRKMMGRIVNPEDGSAPTKMGILEARWVHMSPVYDFQTPIRPMQDKQGRVGFVPEAIVLSPDFVLGKSVAYLRPSVIMFFDDMDAADREVLVGFMSDADKLAVEIRAKRLNLDIK